jgi:hypothetical protein
MLFCPVIWPNDTVVCHPFNRTLLDPSQPESLRKSVATYLGAGSTAALITRPVKCPIDFQTGISIPGVSVPPGFYLMWARPLTRNDASEKDSLYTTNDLASDLLEYGNRTRSDWCSRVEAARSGKHGVFVDSVVTGPAILFYKNPRDGNHASVDIDWIIWNKMGNAGSWFETGVTSPPDPPPRPVEGKQYHEERLIVAAQAVEAAAAAAQEHQQPLFIQIPGMTIPDEVVSEIKEIVPESHQGHGHNHQVVDDADDPLAVAVSPSTVAAAAADEALPPPLVKDGFVLILRPAAAADDNKTPQMTETSIIPSSSTPDMPPESSPKRRKRTTPVAVSEKTIYQTRRRSGIQKVNPRYAK